MMNTATPEHLDGFNFEVLAQDDHRLAKTHMSSKKRTIYGFSYWSLVKLLGKPTYEEPSGDNKTHIEWVLLDDEGRITTLYSWKWESVQQVKDHCHEWNMGGHDDGMYRDMEDWLEVKGLELLAERNRIMKRAK